MKRFGKVVIEGHKRNNFHWAAKVLIFSICLSMIFGFLSQTLLSSMGAIIASVCICVFIFISVAFDMLGIAAAGASEEQFIAWKEAGIKGANVGLKLCHNSEKVCSFCADVVGDICSTLSGAGGACVVVTIASHLSSPALIMFISVCVSALIAGVTIFFKALMKQRALTQANQIILRLGHMLEITLYREKVKKSKKL